MASGGDRQRRAGRPRGAWTTASGALDLAVATARKQTAAAARGAGVSFGAIGTRVLGLRAVAFHDRIATFETDPAEWQGPPSRVMPGVAAAERLLVATSSLTIRLAPMLIYPSGVHVRFDITDSAATRGDPRRCVADEMFSGVDGAFEVEIEDADGGRAIAAPPRDEPPARTPVLAIQQAEGAPGIEQVSYWLSPLPPPGLLTITISWKRRGIAETITQIDGDLLRRGWRRF